MVAPTSHSNSRAELARCAHFCCHVARSPPFRADTVGQSPSLNGMTNGHELRNMHGEHDSPCIFRTAGHDNQKCDLWPCPTHDAPASEKPVRHHDFPTVALYPPTNSAFWRWIITTWHPVHRWAKAPLTEDRPSVDLGYVDGPRPTGGAGYPLMDLGPSVEPRSIDGPRGPSMDLGPLVDPGGSLVDLGPSMELRFH